MEPQYPVRSHPQTLCCSHCSTCFRNCPLLSAGLSVNWASGIGCVCGCSQGLAYSWDSPACAGKKTFCAIAADDRGITPACAGKRAPAAHAPAFAQDHPRTRGEKSRGLTLPLIFQGSPPHTRGKAILLTLSRSIVRITPAHAGKRYPIPGRRFCSRDHPRACGEKESIKVIGLQQPGSPPRMRGKARHGIRRRATDGITTAHAGKSG